MQSEQDPLIGKRLERFQIVDRLGGGGMGTVLKARDLTLERDVAIKVLHAQFASDLQFQERFLQEARTAARLNHPGIVKVFDFGVQETYLYIVMEFIPGVSLRQRQMALIAARNKMRIQEAVGITVQVAEALDYAHNLGVFHRDIKPDNIMLKPHQTDVFEAAAPSNRPPRVQAILTDLGLAKLAEGGMSTVAGLTLGTPAYMSPEQLKDEPVTARSDVYALGVLLYEILAARPPFPVQTLTDAVRRVTKEPTPPLRPHRDDLPEALEATILQALAKDPLERYASTGEFAHVLGDVLASMANLPVDELKTEGQADATMIELDRRDGDLAQRTSINQKLSDLLEAKFPDGEVRSLPLEEEFTIGRDKSNDLVLPDGKVSRRHAILKRTNRGYMIIDLESSNGTYLNDNRLSPKIPVFWEPGQEVRIGRVILTIRAGKVANPSTLILDPVELDASPPSQVPNNAVDEPSPIQPPPPQLNYSPSAQADEIIDFDAAFEHDRLVVPGVGSVVIVNRDSRTAVFRVELASKDGKLHFEPSQGALRLNPGQKNSFKFTVHPERVPLFGKGTLTSIEAQVASNKDESQVLSTDVVIKPRLPIWVVPAVAGLCLLSVFGCFLVNSLLR